MAKAWDYAGWSVERLRDRLEALNESIYEPEEHMQASERDRRIAERDRVWERMQEIESGE